MSGKYAVGVVFIMLAGVSVPVLVAMEAPKSAYLLTVGLLCIGGAIEAGCYWRMGRRLFDGPADFFGSGWSIFINLFRKPKNRP